MHMIAGTHESSTGMMIVGYYFKHTGFRIDPPYSAIGWTKDGQMLGQVVFRDYTGANIEIHIHAPKCMNRKTIKQVFRYAFEFCKCSRITAKICGNNEKFSQLLDRLGFTYECTQQGYYGTAQEPIDAIIYKLTKENALRWLNGFSKPS